MRNRSIIRGLVIFNLCLYLSSAQLVRKALTHNNKFVSIVQLKQVLAPQVSHSSFSLKDLNNENEKINVDLVQKQKNFFTDFNHAQDTKVQENVVSQNQQQRQQQEKDAQKQQQLEQVNDQQQQQLEQVNNKQQVNSQQQQKQLQQVNDEQQQQQLEQEKGSNNLDRHHHHHKSHNDDAQFEKNPEWLNKIEDQIGAHNDQQQSNNQQIDVSSQMDNDSQVNNDPTAQNDQQMDTKIAHIVKNAKYAYFNSAGYRQEINKSLHQARKNAHNNISVNKQSQMKASESYQSSKLGNHNIQEMIKKLNQQLQNSNMPVGDCIQIFSQCNYQGESLEACDSLDQIKNFASLIYSIYIPDGFQVTLFDQTNFGGHQQIFDTSVDCIPKPMAFTQLHHLKFHHHQPKLSLQVKYH